MVRRWLLPLIAAVVLFAGIAGAIRFADGDGWNDDRDRDRVTRVVNADGTETIVIQDDRDHFFPFGLLFFPLFFLFIFGIGRALFWRGHRGGPGGPGGWGGGNGGPSWFDEWHRRAHAGDTSPPAATPATPDASSAPAS